MAKHRHILLDGPGEARNYTNPRSGGGDEFPLPPRNRTTHARKLISDVRQAKDDAEALAKSTGHVIRDICLEIIGEKDYPLKAESLENRRLKPAIELLSVRERDDTQYATVYVPEGKLGKFLRKIERYESENTPASTAYPSGRPKNEDLVAGIDSIRFPVLRSFWSDDEDLYPTSKTETIWWEVWLRVGPTETPDAAFTAFVETVASSQLKVGPHFSEFPERLVFLAFGSREQWIHAFVPLLDRLAELRRAKELPTEFLRLNAVDQREFVEDLTQRLTLPGPDSPAVCLLDHGVHTAHPLLRPFITDEDAQALNPDWPVVDHAEAHGTEMAGLTIFGDSLPDMLAGNTGYTLLHRLESVRMLHSAQPHHEDSWGYVTQACLAMAEVQAPSRPRVACLPITARDMGRDHGRPTEWSAAVDQHASGQLDEDDQRRLYVVAAGNIRNIKSAPTYTYPDTNLSSSGIEDPGQSWNALTVGAFTNRVQLRSPDLAGHQPVAPRGGLCPSSRTSRAWDDDTWPLKPDIVMEGGNYSLSPAGQIDGCDDLSLLTTSMTPSGGLFTLMGDTSAATALAARSTAIIMADYPELWPETVRGLLVHSAKWTDEMRRQVPGDLQRDRQDRLRCFGYGVPDLDRARHTVENRVSLVHQGTIQPFKLDGTAKTNHFVLHSLPWPRAALDALHDQDVTVRITLSYFIEPSPGGRGRGTKFRYASHGLRFALRGPTETEHQFRQRISSQEWEEEQDRPSTSDPFKDYWAIGAKLRTRGSIHSDWVTTSAAELARCGQVAVSPVTGWWKERKHLGFVERQARYSLIITISTQATEVDLYTPIAQEVGLITEIET